MAGFEATILPRGLHRDGREDEVVRGLPDMAGSTAVEILSGLRTPIGIESLELPITGPELRRVAGAQPVRFSMTR